LSTINICNTLRRRIYTVLVNANKSISAICINNAFRWQQNALSIVTKFIFCTISIINTLRWRFYTIIINTNKTIFATSINHTFRKILNTGVFNAYFAIKAIRITSALNFLNYTAILYANKVSFALFINFTLKNRETKLINALKLLRTIVVLFTVRQFYYTEPIYADTLFTLLIKLTREKIGNAEFVKTKFSLFAIFIVFATRADGETGRLDALLSLSAVSIVLTVREQDGDTDARITELIFGTT